MAERRMFTKKITDNDNFLQLSSSAQALYFHINMSADDDGFCNQVTACMFKAHASTQDLEALLSKHYLYQFESGVVVVKHWKMSNFIPNDRYKPTAYIEEYNMLKLKENKAYTLDKNYMETKCIQNVYNMDTECIQNGTEMDTQVRLGKDSIDKVSIGEVSIGEVRVGESSREEKINYQLIADMYNETCVSFPKLTKLSDDRKKAIKARTNKYSVADFQTMFTKAEASDFLKGANNRNWQANFDWMIKDANMAKILDGNYDNKSGQAKAVKSYRDMSPTERLAQELDDSYEMMRQWVNESEG